MAAYNTVMNMEIESVRINLETVITTAPPEYYLPCGGQHEMLRARGSSATMSREPRDLGQ